MAGMFTNIKIEAFAKKRFGRYVLYAIGEIILVVVGILIALAINNKNEEKQQKKYLQGVLQNVAYDLEKDTLLIANAISYYEVRGESAKKIIQDSMEVAQLKKCLFCGNMITTFFPITLNDKGYTQLKSFASNTQKKDSLALDIVQFYKAYSELLNEIDGQIKQNAFENIKYYKGNMPWFYKTMNGAYKEAFFEYMTTSDFKNRVAYYYALTSVNMTQILKNYKQNATLLLEKIEERNTNS